MKSLFTIPTPVADAPPIPLLELSDVVLSFDGTPQTIHPEGKYYIPSGVAVSVTGAIVGGELISLPILKLVAEENADDKPIGREIYVNGTITEGALSASITFSNSANYKVTSARNNKAIDRMFYPEIAPFHLSFKTLDFLS
jgi:hypothetical protein